jgi:hypothetical protein
MAEKDIEVRIEVPEGMEFTEEDMATLKKFFEARVKTAGTTKKKPGHRPIGEGNVVKIKARKPAGKKPGGKKPGAKK